MTLSLIIGAIWVIAATITALLPMRRQYGPGLSPVIAAPSLIGWIIKDQAAIWDVLADRALDRPVKASTPRDRDLKPDVA